MTFRAEVRCLRLTASQEGLLSGLAKRMLQRDSRLLMVAFERHARTTLRGLRMLMMVKDGDESDDLPLYFHYYEAILLPLKPRIILGFIEEAGYRDVENESDWVAINR